jgi:hypothetical protein
LQHPTSREWVAEMQFVDPAHQEKIAVWGSGAVVSSWYLLFPASKPKSGRNSTYPGCADFPSQL